MVAESITHERENGIYYTPPDLAEFLANLMTTVRSKTTILDPAYGEGALLLAAEKIYKKDRKNSINLYGCDTKPVNGLLKHLPKANLKKVNFLKYSPDNKFSLILMNPPYVRHHLQTDESLAGIKKNFSVFKILSNSADLWSYFLLKSVLHLKRGGSIGAILPWSFLQADYAKPLRAFLAEKFGAIKVITLSEEYFQKAQERVVIVSLTRFGKTCESIQIAATKNINSTISYSELSIDNWKSDKVHYSGDEDLSAILMSCRQNYGFEKLGGFANVLIGVVTGADKYFIRNKSEIKKLKIKSKNLIPIISTSKEFVDVLNNGAENLKRLIVLKRKNYREYQSLIQKGRNSLYHLRAHAMLRDPWYQVKIGKIPDAFFPYRVGITPFLLFNNYNVQSTNSVHRIYFNNVSEVEKKWIHISLISNIGQLSLETYSKTYGRGMLKIEPRSLKEALTLRKHDPVINEIYDEVQILLKANNKAKASEVATNFISKYLELPIEFKKKIEGALKRIQNIRLNNLHIED